MSSLHIRKAIRYIALFSIFQFSIIHSFAQPLSKKETLTHADTLRGTYGPSRDWWDVLKYDLHVKVNIDSQTIAGFNTIRFKPLKKGNLLQIDLQEPMIIDSIVYHAWIVMNKKMNGGMKATNITTTHEKIRDIKKDGNAYFISFKKAPSDRSFNELTVYYHGKPRIARNPPWDGGLIWKKDKNKNPWVTVACQGLGASVWYPCKDHQADEPDSAELVVTCPADLVCVGNGKLRSKTDHADGTITYDWAVVNPINNYCIIPYIGKYVNFKEVYKGELGDLDMDYWVLDYNLEKAKEQFKDAGRMMKAFEYWFGPYPFYEDGYKLVDAPHLGMEHQSATAYGNGYKMGYAGRDLSASGWGMKWDFIIVHESGHEWFANNITSKDIADMWIHESFTNYSETLFTEYFYGKDAGSDYVTGTRKLISNDKPIIGPYDVNKEGSGDMYYKGGNMLHTIRQVINDDSLFRLILRGLNKDFWHQTVTTKQVEDYMSSKSGKDLSKIFDQYLRNTSIPKLQYKLENKTLSYKWVNCVPGFNMPVKVLVGTDKYEWISPDDASLKTIQVELGNESDFKVDRNFYVSVEKIK